MTPREMKKLMMECWDDLRASMPAAVPRIFLHPVGDEIFIGLGCNGDLAAVLREYGLTR